MTDSTQATILRRMTSSHETDVAENPLTSSRAVRLALTKAANDSVGLVLTVSSVAEDVSALDAMLDGLPDGLMGTLQNVKAAMPFSPMRIISCFQDISFK